MNTIKGYEFIVADNTVCLPSATGTQNEALYATTVYEEDEDVILVVSGLLPRLIAQAKAEGLE